MNESVLNGFSVERLRAFCRVAETGAIVTAANGDPTRSSQISRQIKELEEFLGVKLVIRSGKSIQLTEDGKKVAVLSHSFFRAVEDIRTSSTRKNSLRIGAGESILRWVLMPRLAAIQNLDSSVAFEFFTRSTEDCVDCIRRGDLDLAIVRNDAVDATLSALACGSLSYSLVVPRKLLPGRMADGLRLVRSLPFAMLSGEGLLNRGILTLAKSWDFKLDIRIRAENFSLLLSAAQNASLATVIPAPAVAELSKETFAVIPLEGIDLLSRTLSVVFSAEAANLRQVVRRIAPRIASVLAPSL